MSRESVEPSIALNTGGPALRWRCLVQYSHGTHPCKTHRRTTTVPSHPQQQCFTLRPPASPIHYCCDAHNLRLFALDSRSHGPGAFSVQRRRSPQQSSPLQAEKKSRSSKRRLDVNLRKRTRADCGELLRRVRVKGTYSLYTAAPRRFPLQIDTQAKWCTFFALAVRKDRGGFNFKTIT